MDDIDPINVVHAALVEAVGEIRQVHRTDGVRPTSLESAVLATALLRRGVTFGPAPVVRAAESDRLAAIEARLDALETVQNKPTVIVDCDGDLWTWDAESGGYRCKNLNGNYTRDSIASMFGIREEIR